MIMYFKKLAPFFMLLIAFTLVEGGLNADYADARSKFGGRSFKMTRKAPAKTTQGINKQNTGGFGRGLAGGLLGFGGAWVSVQRYLLHMRPGESGARN